MPHTPCSGALCMESLGKRLPLYRVWGILNLVMRPHPACNTEEVGGALERYICSIPYAVVCLLCMESMGRVLVN